MTGQPIWCRLPLGVLARVQVTYTSSLEATPNAEAACQRKVSYLLPPKLPRHATDNRRCTQATALESVAVCMLHHHRLGRVGEQRNAQSETTSSYFPIHSTTRQARPLPGALNTHNTRNTIMETKGHEADGVCPCQAETTRWHQSHEPTNLEVSVQRILMEWAKL